MPSTWNRTRATALAATLLLHGVVAAWLLAARPAPLPALVDQTLPVWLPALPDRVPPLPVEPLPVTIELTEPADRRLPETTPQSQSAPVRS